MSAFIAAHGKEVSVLMSEEFCCRCKKVITAKPTTRIEYYSHKKNKRLLKRCRSCLDLTIHISRYSIISNTNNKKLKDFEREMEEMANSDEGHWWAVVGVILDI